MHTKNLSRASWLFVCIGLGCLPAGPSRAGSLEVSPVLVELPPGETTTTINITNRAAEATAVQARAYEWSQTGDKDTTTPASDVIISPPIFTIAAGEAQTLRLLLRHGNSPGERTFRLLLDEVPRPNSSAPGQIKLALSLSLPVITHGSSDFGNARLAWRMIRDATGHIAVEATNTGNHYAKVSRLTLTLPGGRSVQAKAVGSNPYVLVGATRHWILPESLPAGVTVHLDADTTGGRSTQDLSPPT